MNKKKIITFLLIVALGVGCLSCASDQEGDLQEASAEITDDLLEVSAEIDDDLQDASAMEENDTEENALQEAPAEKTTDTQKASEADEDNMQNISSQEENELQENASEEDADGQKEEASYTVDRWEEAKTMYVISPVNVRKGPSTSYELCGHLAAADPITVLGTANTGWYLIAYQDEENFVSNRYLQDTPPTPAPQEQLIADAPQASAAQDQTASNETPAAAPQPQAPAPTAEPPKAVASTIFVGDSRFVQMHEAVGDNGVTWICENSKGYLWFEEKAVPRIDNLVGQGTKILINLGVNDTQHADSYITLVNGKAAEWTQKGATVYYASVNPVWENPYVTNDQVVAFNSKVSAGLSGVVWIDSYTYLTENGYRLVDGLHYADETYSAIYSYFMSRIQ